MHTVRQDRLWAEIGTQYLRLINYGAQRAVPWDPRAPTLHFVIVLTDRIGDALNSIYFLSNLRRLYPQARLTYIGPAFGDAEFQRRIIGPYVDRVVLSNSLREAEFLALRPDVVFDLNPEASLFSYYPRRLGLRIGHHPLCDIHIPQVTYNMKANDHLNILRVFGADVQFTYPPIVLPPARDDRVLLARPRRPYVVLCLEATARAWMMSHETMTAFIEYLLEQDRWDVFLCGNNINENGYAYRGGSPRVHQCTGVLSLYQTICVLGGAEYVVSVDTGLMHAASYLGRPLLALFTCGEPHKNGPQGQRGPTVLVDVHADVPKIEAKMDQVHPFTEQAFLRVDHVVEGFEALLHAEPTTVQERLLEVSTTVWAEQHETQFATK